MHNPPFNTKTGQETVRTSLNEIEGVDIAPERLGGRPRIPLAVFENPESLRRLTAVLDQIVGSAEPRSRRGRDHRG
jgi:hypothetical protein